MPHPVLATLAAAPRARSLDPSAHVDSKNACKACALGMGGQNGGRTNELGEFPTICRKSLQAHSSDTQDAIPERVFDHPLAELAQLSGRELEHLGRLNTVLHKAAGSDRYRPVGWGEAVALAADRLRATAPERTFFYASGRSSNEAGFLLQLLARLYGTNNVNNCSYYCHQASSEGLATTVGTGTATLDLEQLVKADCIFVLGANPSSNHPRFLTLLKACRERGGTVVIVNPAKEPGLAEFAKGVGPTAYLQPRVGSDQWLLRGLGKAVLEADRVDQAFVRDHTEGFEAWRAELEATSWPAIVRESGVAEGELRSVAALYAASEHAVFAWGMGLTHHRHGTANVEAVANLALLRGMVGKPAAGLLPIRGHSNIQGMGTIGVKPTLPAEMLARLEAALGLTLPTAKGLDTLACLEAAAAGRIDAAVLLGGNLYSATPDSAWTKAALERVGLKVFLTTTLNHGHVLGLDGGEALVFPVAARDEEHQPTTQESMFNFVRVSDGGVVRLDNVRSEVDVLCDLATALLPPGKVDFSRFREHRHVQKALAAAVPGLEAVADVADTKKEFTIGGRLLTTPEFRRPGGRAAFVVRPAPSSPATAAYPFVLASVRSEGQFNSIVYDEADKFRKTATRWCVLLGRADLEALGLAPGDRADVTSPTGSMLGVTVYEYDLPRGNALAYYPEANVLIPTDRDERSHTPAFKSTAVAITAHARMQP